MSPAPTQRATALAWPTLASLFAFACGAPPRQAVPAAAPLPASSGFVAALDDFFASEFRAEEPGGGILVMKGDRVVFAHGYGLADLKTRQPVSTRTLFDVATVTK